MGEKRDQLAAMEEITLQNDTGANITFTGRLVAENSFYDEETGRLTQQRLFVTSNGLQAYSVISSDGRDKERRAYIISRQGELCKINNGLFDVTVNTRNLVTAVKSLVGLKDGVNAEELLDSLGNQEKAVNE